MSRFVDTPDDTGMDTTTKGQDTMDKATVRNNLLVNTACASCTSEADRKTMADLNRIPGQLDGLTDAELDRAYAEADKFAAKLARRHTCSDYYPTALLDAKSVYTLEGNDDDGRLSYRVVYRFHDNRLYGPIESTVAKAQSGFRAMVNRITY